MKEISKTIPDMKALSNRVSEHLGWCRITPLSGELDEEIYLATFSDDSKILFEDNHGKISLLLTNDQEYSWSGLSEEEQIPILETILLYYFRSKTA